MRWLVAIASCLIAVAPATASAQTFPSKPLRLVVPYAPGGNTDMIGRTLAQKLTDSMGQTVVVENRAGAVLDHDGLPHAVGELLRERAPDHVGVAAGSVGNDEAQRLRRKRLCRRSRGCDGDQATCDRDQPSHCSCLRNASQSLPSGIVPPHLRGAAMPAWQDFHLRPCRASGRLC